MQRAPEEEPKKQGQSKPQPTPERQAQPLESGEAVWNTLFSQPTPEGQIQSPYLQQNLSSQPEANELNLPVPKPGYVRQVFDFSPSTAMTLRELAKGGSIGDALRDAIALSKWFKDTREEGGRILVERNGKVREVTTVKYPADKSN